MIGHCASVLVGVVGFGAFVGLEDAITHATSKAHRSCFRLFRVRSSWFGG